MRPHDLRSSSVVRHTALTTTKPRFARPQPSSRAFSWDPEQCNKPARLTYTAAIAAESSLVNSSGAVRREARNTFVANWVNI